MISTNNPPAYYVSVEEFIPRTNVSDMLQFVEQLEQMHPVQSNQTFGDLKQAMSWMKRYILTTSEFWEWTNDTFDIDGDTLLTVQLLGFGWAIAVISKKSHTEEDIGGEEKRLIQTLDKLTGHISVQAVLRIKASGWSDVELHEVAESLRLGGTTCSVSSKSTLEFPGLGAKIHTFQGERLECPHVSRDLDTNIWSILTRIKEFANRNFEGARWCAYQRRRLTLVQKIGSESISETDIRFLEHPEYGREGKILASRVTMPPGGSAIFCFVRAKYHIGNIHPRALIASQQRLTDLKELVTYIYYLWHAHFTKIWLYLLFEDVYVYAEDLRSSKEYNDPKILHYWYNLLKTNDIIAELRIYDRIDRGEFYSYRPPHLGFVENAVSIPGIVSVLKPIEWLRTFLIEATTTQLRHEPLSKAVDILDRMDEQMKTSLNLFVQTVDIRTQKSLQIIQFLFIVAAVAQVLQLFSLGSYIAGSTIKYISSRPQIVNLLLSVGITNLSAIESTISVISSLILLILVTALSIILLRTSFFKRFLDRLFGSI